VLRQSPRRRGSHSSVPSNTAARIWLASAARLPNSSTSRRCCRCNNAQRHPCRLPSTSVATSADDRCSLLEIVLFKSESDREARRDGQTRGRRAAPARRQKGLYGLPVALKPISDLRDRPIPLPFCGGLPIALGDICSGCCLQSSWRSALEVFLSAPIRHDPAAGVPAPRYSVCCCSQSYHRAGEGDCASDRCAAHPPGELDALVSGR
jgi:hypothetical protein